MLFKDLYLFVNKFFLYLRYIGKNIGKVCLLLCVKGVCMFIVLFLLVGLIFFKGVFVLSCVGKFYLWKSCFVWVREMGFVLV